MNDDNIDMNYIRALLNSRFENNGLLDSIIRYTDAIEQETTELERAIELSFEHEVEASQKRRPKLSLQEYTNKVSTRNTKKKDREPGVVCPICHEGYKTHKIATLSCKHEFHHTCVLRWLTKYGADCPVCKKSVL